MCNTREQREIHFGEENPPLVGKMLQDKLSDHLRNGHYDVFHFSGHSFSSPEHGGPFLVLPDSEGCALAVPISSVAKWLNEGGCHLMVLSSCQGASVMTAMETMKGGAEGVIGFRWEVNDRLCADYFDRFYRGYFSEGHSFSESFRDACDVAIPDDTLLPTWASAVAVLRD